MVCLTLIHGGKNHPQTKYYVAELHEDDGEGFQLCMVTGEMGRLDNGSISRLDTPLGWVVDDKAAADVFCAAMNERYERDMAGMDEDDRRLGNGRYAKDGDS